MQATWTPKRLKEKEEEWQKKQKAQTANTSSPVKYAANTLHSSAIRPHYDIPTTIFEAGDISTPLPALATALMSQEEVIETSFSKFKYRLHVASMKWIQSQQMTGRARLQVNKSIYSVFFEG